MGRLLQSSRTSSLPLRQYVNATGTDIPDVIVVRIWWQHHIRPRSLTVPTRKTYDRKLATGRHLVM